MDIKYGNGKTKYGTGVEIVLSGEDVATAIMAYLVAKKVHIDGPRTITVNGELCKSGQVYVDPSGFVITKKGNKLSGRGVACDNCNHPHEKTYGENNEWCENCVPY